MGTNYLFDANSLVTVGYRPGSLKGAVIETEDHKNHKVAIMSGFRGMGVISHWWAGKIALNRLFGVEE